MQIKLLVISIVVGLISLIQLPPLRAEGHQQDARIVAMVGNEVIRYKDIGETPMRAKYYFQRQFGREPTSAIGDIQQLTLLSHKDERLRLARMIRHLVTLREINRFGIHISDADLQSAWKVYLGNANTGPSNFAAQLKTQGQSLQVVVAALNLVYEKGQNPDVVYNTILSGKILPVQWQVYLRDCKTPESRSRLAELALAEEHTTSASVSIPSEGFRDYEVGKKLNILIIHDISAHDTQFTKYNNLIKHNPMDAKLFEKASEYIRAGINSWWKQQYSRMHVRILDPEYDTLQ